MSSQSTINNGTQTSYDRINDLKVFDEQKSGVKGVVDAGIIESIPSIFVRSSEDRSKDFGTYENNISVPTIDIGGVGESDEETANIADKIILASKEWGFFQVVNHGIPLELLEKAIHGTRMFHEQDVEAKKQFYSRDFFSKKVTFFAGYDMYKSKKAVEWRDTLYVTMAGEVEPQDLPPICKDVIMEYGNHIHKLNERILMLLSIGLGLEPKYLGELENSKESWSLLCHYYPACPDPQLAMGIGKHADNTFISILLQDHIGGLQILHQNQWVNVEPVTGALIINIGNILQMITNDMLKSAYHRVISKSVGPRVSVAFFFHGLFSAKKKYGPIKELTSDQNPPIYREFTIEELITYFFSKSRDEFGIDYFKL